MMERLDDTEMAKLPRWAQNHLTGCYSQMDSMARERRAFFQHIPASAGAGITLPYFHGATRDLEKDDQPLSDYQRVKFAFDNPMDKRFDFITVGFTVKKDRVEIYGSRKILIEPSASNVALVHLAED